jgi:hypothetical protein
MSLWRWSIVTNNFSTSALYLWTACNYQHVLVVYTVKSGASEKQQWTAWYDSLSSDVCFHCKQVPSPPPAVPYHFGDGEL